MAAAKMSRENQALCEKAYREWKGTGTTKYQAAKTNGININSFYSFCDRYEPVASGVHPGLLLMRGIA